MSGFFLKTQLILLLSAVLVSGIDASEFRRFDPITVAPRETGGIEPEVRTIPVPRHLVEEGVRQIIESWNGPGFQSYVSDRAYDKYRLLDAVESYVPRDASLRLLALEDVQTLRQYQREGGDYGVLVSEVGVDVVTQIEFEDPVDGFQRRNGTIELVLEVTQPLIPADEGR